MSASRSHAMDALAGVHESFTSDWRGGIAAQQVLYASERKQLRVLSALSRADASLQSDGFAALSAHLERVGTGDAFVLQMVDCAGPIADANATCPSSRRPASARFPQLHRDISGNASVPHYGMGIAQ